MNIARLEKIYIAVLLVIFGGIVLHAPFSVGFGVLFPDFELVIKSWKEILMLVLIPVAVFIVMKRGMWRDLLRDWIARLIIAFTVLHLLTITLLFKGAIATAAGLAIDLRYILFFALIYIAIKALPHYRRLFIQIGTVGAFVVVGFATLQLFLPPDFLKIIGYSNDTIVPYLTVDKNPDYIRVNSTLRGPNPLGAYAGMVLALLTAAIVKGRLQLQDNKILIGTILLAACSVIALWISYSRSSLVAGIIAVAIVVVLTGGRRLSRQNWIALCIVIFAVAGALVMARGNAIISNVLFHENLSGGSAISSNDDHVESLATGIDRLVYQPLGAGVGSTGSASLYTDEPFIVENQYLFVAHETGWLGLILFGGLFILILMRLWSRRKDWLALGVFASGIGLALIGLLLPVWVDDTVAILWWGLAAIVVAGGKHGR